MSLISLVKSKLQSRAFKDLFKLFCASENEANLQIESMDIVSTLVDNLEEAHHRNDIKLLSACEDMLKLIAEKCVPQEVLLEVLERIESSQDDNIFTSLLKVLQVILLRFNEKKVRSLEWSLNTIYSYVDRIELPDYVSKVGEAEEKLLECDETIRRILLLYMTVLLFLEPIWKTLDNKESIFKSTGLTRKNVVICFVLHLLGKHLLHLDTHYKSYKEDEIPVVEDVKTYSRQVVEDLISVMCNLLGDPFQLLPYGEKRMRWRCSRTRQNDSPILNIFMSEEKCPRLGLAMYHYFLLGEDLLPSTTPTVYAKHHIFEMCLYYCVTLMTHDQSSAHHKGIMLAKRLLKVMAVDKLTSDNLDVQIHQEFCTSLSKLIVYSSSERTRKDGTFLLRDYILQFDSKGSYLVIANLLKTIKHSGLHSYVATIYKDLVNKHLNCVDEPDAWFVGASLKHLLLTEICVLIDGIGTDLVENSDTVITGLNVLRFLLIRDKLNQTGIWEYTTEIEQNYLLPLRKSLDLSKAHFKEEQSTVIQSRTSIKDSEVDVCVSVINGESVPEINREKKLELLNDAFNKFDLMECLLARVIDCMNSNPKNT